MADTTPDRKQEIRGRAEADPYVTELQKGLKDLSELVSTWYGRAEKAEARVAELEADRDTAVAAAVRRALEDAADVLEANAEEWDGWPDKQHVMRKDADWLRDRAAAVASPAREQGVPPQKEN